MTDFLELFTICLVPLAMGWWPCPECCDDIEDADTPCTDCTNTPKYYRVVFSGSLADQDCDACENIPTTYVAEQNSACEWRTLICNCNTLDPFTAVNSSVKVIITLSGGDYILRVEVRVEIRNGGTGTHDLVRFEKNLGTSKPDCKSFSAEALTFDSVVTNGDVCGDWSALSCTVTAVNGPADDERQCPYCTWNTMPDEFTAEVSGLTNGTCSDCSSDTGPATLTRTVSGGNCCNWIGSYVGSSCTYRYTLSITDGLYTVTLDINGFVAATYTKSVSQPEDCSQTQTLTHSSGSTSHCGNFAGSTVAVIAA